MQSKKRRFLQELTKAFDYQGIWYEFERNQRNKAMNEVNKIKLELEKQNRLKYESFLRQIIINENLATGLRIWAANEFNRINNDDIIRLRHKQVKEIVRIQNSINNITVRDVISFMISEKTNDLSDSHTLGCLDNTKADLN